MFKRLTISKKGDDLINKPIEPPKSVTDLLESLPAATVEDLKRHFIREGRRETMRKYRKRLSDLSAENKALKERVARSEERND